MNNTVQCNARIKPHIHGAGVCLAALYIAVNAHMLRNLSVLYPVLLAAIEIAATVYVLRNSLRYLRTGLGRWHLAFLLISVGAVLQTLYDYGLPAGAYASIRFYMVAPLVPLAAIALDSPKKVALFMKCFIVIVCVGVASVAVQYATGPVSWFAEPGERGGLMRFGSILGSLPTIGGALPLALFATLTIRMRWMTRLIAILILVFGVLVSLSKGAVAGTALATALFLCIPTPNRKRNLTVLVAVVVIALVIAPFAASNQVVDQTSLYVAALFMQDSTDRGGDVTMQASMQERWTSLPAQSLGWLFHVRGSTSLLTGGGFQMLGSALMPDGDSRYFTSHDTYVDLILVAGVPLLTAYFALLIGTLRQLFSEAGRAFFSEAPEIRTCTLGILVIIALAGLFSAGETYQPIIAALWAALTGVAIRIEHDRLSRMKGVIRNALAA
jgi:hypothetical protein